MSALAIKNELKAEMLDLSRQIHFFWDDAAEVRKLDEEACENQKRLHLGWLMEFHIKIDEELGDGNGTLKANFVKALAELRYLIEVRCYQEYFEFIKVLQKYDFVGDTGDKSFSEDFDEKIQDAVRKYYGKFVLIWYKLLGADAMVDDDKKDLREYIGEWQDTLVKIQRDAGFFPRDRDVDQIFNEAIYLPMGLNVDKFISEMTVPTEDGYDTIPTPIILIEFDEGYFEQGLAGDDVPPTPPSSPLPPSSSSSSSSSVPPSDPGGVPDMEAVLLKVQSSKWTEIYHHWNMCGDDMRRPLNEEELFLRSQENYEVVLRTYLNVLRAGLLRLQPSQNRDSWVDVENDTARKLAELEAAIVVTEARIDELVALCTFHGIISGLAAGTEPQTPDGPGGRGVPPPPGDPPASRAPIPSPVYVGGRPLGRPSATATAPAPAAAAGVLPDPAVAAAAAVPVPAPAVPVPAPAVPVPPEDIWDDREDRENDPEYKELDEGDDLMTLEQGNTPKRQNYMAYMKHNGVKRARGMDKVACPKQELHDGMPEKLKYHCGYWSYVHGGRSMGHGPSVPETRKTKRTMKITRSATGDMVIGHS